MKKLVLKTVAITLVAVLGVCMIIFGTLAMVAPVKVASLFDAIGWYGPSVHYYEKQYGKSNNIEDLAVLILKIDDENDCDKEKKFVEIMLNRTDYKDYCTALDKANEFSAIKTNELYCGKYALALVRIDKFDDALDFSFDFIGDNSYSSYNPFSVIIAELGESLTLEQLEKLESSISRYSYNTTAKSDLSEINRLIANKSAK